MRWFENRPNVCVACGKPVVVRSTTSTHPEAPEMLQLPPDAWMGLVQGDATMEMVVTCSQACCVQLLLEESD